jgi:ribosomal protein S18 acetylase RimI-like enzyme
LEELVSEHVRPAVAADRGTIEEIVTQAYEPWVSVVGGRPAPMDADYRELIGAGSVYVLAGSEVHGVIVLTPEPDTLMVDNVAVRPDQQGRGIGHELLAFAEVTAQRLGLPAIRLFTHGKMTGNIRLYDTLGYVVTGREAIEGGHLVHMRKTL